jgi:hypothetical protein
MTMQHDVKAVYTDVLLTEIGRMDPPDSRAQSTETGE